MLHCACASGLLRQDRMALGFLRKRISKPVAIQTYLNGAPVAGEHTNSLGADDRPRLPPSEAQVESGNVLPADSVIGRLPSTARSWWGRYNFVSDSWRKIECGSQTFFVRRSEQVWELCLLPSEQVRELDAPPPQARISRAISTEKSDSLVFAPRLPDRPLVFRPTGDFYVGAQERVVVYFRVPLWVVVCVPNPWRELLEMPLCQLSDTWFGPPTTEGQLCYAAGESWHAQLPEVSSESHARVRAEIVNPESSSMRVDRLKLRVGVLGLFATDASEAWTSDVRYFRTKGSDYVTMEVGSQLPICAPTAQLLSEPRRPNNQNVVMRALSQFFETDD